MDKDHRISGRKLRKLINGAQKLKEEQAVSQRQKSVDYDKVLKRQRTIMYDVRNRLLDGGSLDQEMIRHLAYENIQGFLKENSRFSRGDINRYILNNISYHLDNRFVQIDQIKKRALKRVLKRSLLSYVTTIWRNKMRSFSSEEERKEYIRLCCLRAIDDAWVEQVDYLQQLQYVVSGRASAQRNPVFEYHKEAYTAFMRMENTIKKDIVRNIFLGKKAYTETGEMYVLFP